MFWNYVTFPIGLHYCEQVETKRWVKEIKLFFPCFCSVTFILYVHQCCLCAKQDCIDYGDIILKAGINLNSNLHLSYE